MRIGIKSSGTVALMGAFMLMVSRAPGVPTVLSPANGATDVSANPTLQWSATGATSYDVYFGTQNPPPSVATSIRATSYPTTTSASTDYYWRVVARNRWTKNSNAVWTFRTQSSSPVTEIWGVTATDILGTCSAAVHDQYVIDGGDGFYYRTWHPQQDPSGCSFAHEHGDDPQLMQNAEIAARPVLFGYIGRRMPMPNEPAGHEEPHEGFKVFVSNPGDVNDEGRVNRVYSRSVFHMGTDGPKRFNTQLHSADIALIHPEFGLKAFTRLMMDTGGVHTVCSPRANAPTKDVISLGSPCKLDSPYEIWSTLQYVVYHGQTVYTAFATPAVFDPVTVFNPSNPSELVYAWDSRVAAIKNFPNDDWSYFRGCRRESYAQPGYWYNTTALTDFWTDSMGNEAEPSDPLALVQTISRSSSVGVPATNDGLVQFKMRKNWCGPGLGFKN
jgi:hypothetical protein